MDFYLILLLLFSAQRALGSYQRIDHTECSGLNPYQETVVWISGSCEMLCDQDAGWRVHGGWSNWGGWGGCSVSCGGGSRSRTRSCTNPAPQYGGNSCAGSSTDNSNCNTHPCPIHGGWSIWAELSTCSVSCGGGSRLKSRSCNNPSPQHGGKNCVGNPTSTEDCNNHACPVHGGWSAWGEWSGCSVSCGGGTWSRSRSCTNPSPQHGGNNCTGSPTEDIGCSNNLCPMYQVINGTSKLLDDDLTSCQMIYVVDRGTFQINSTSDWPNNTIDMNIVVTPENENKCDELLLLRLTSYDKCVSYKECQRMTESSTSKDCQFQCHCSAESYIYELISTVEQGTSVCELVFF